MILFRKLREKLDAYLYDSSINIKDRTFVLFSLCELAALIAAMGVGITLSEPIMSTLLSLAFVVICTALLVITVKKDKISVAKTVVAFLIVGIMTPGLFFAKGGIYCGGPFSLLLGAYYLVLVLDGTFRIVMSLIEFCVITACYVISYIRPETVVEFTRESDYSYSYAKFVIAWASLTVLITFWTRMYQKEARRAEEKTKELEEMNRAQNRFFSSMSHEIRTPINTVLGLNELILRQEDASEEIRRDSRNIRGAGKMLLALINDILDVSKIEAGKMDIVPVNYNVASLLSEMVNMIWLKAEEKGLGFNVDIDPNVPETLFGDEVRVKQILINLLNNAVKYTNEGTITLHMECEFCDTGDVILMIQVSDTGMGIKPEAIPHLFDTFQRVDEEKNRHIEGTGLGLSIVKQLVELMDGQITVNSVYTEGSAFTVTLRQGVSSDKRIGDMNIANVGGISGSEKFEHSFHAPSARILIVDDNEMNLQVEKKLLVGTGMTIDTALSGQAALTLTLQNRYDVIFMDHLMPEMDGIDCYRRIRDQKGGLNNETPIIVLTANAGGENIELYNSTGFDGYLVKPVSGEQLEETLLRHLPAEKVISNTSEGSGGSLISTASKYARKKPVVIATSTMSDLPANVVRELDIKIIPYTVITDEGVFFDTIDIDSEELVRYMRDEKKVVLSEPPTEEAFVSFFSSELKRAHHLIFITLTNGSSREYGRAIKAAETFDNVTVINSECLSSGTGILTMIAARLVQQNLPVDRIRSELEDVKDLIRCSFVIKSTDVMARRERISPFMNSLLNTLWLHPMLRVKNDNLGVGRLLFGNERKCYEDYIKHALPANVYPDTSFVFITYAGMAEEDLLWIRDLVLQRVKFDRVIFQKASPGIASNCGEGTFGILYIVKGNQNYNLGALFKDDIEESGIEDGSDDETVTEDPVTESVPVRSEKKWYESIPGIDSAAALKNSGSEESFLSVLKIFYDSYAAKADEIKGFYDSKDWENYTIKVHALKSSSRLIGALLLGDQAEALEMAGKNKDTDYIRSHNDELLNGYKVLYEALTPELGQKDDRELIPEDILADAYAGLEEFALSADYELSRMVMDSVREYALAGDDEERFDRIDKCLSQMDWDGMIKILKERL